MPTKLKQSKLMTKPGFVDVLREYEARALELAKNLSKDGKVSKETKKIIKTNYVH